jgi:hypothetical protein
LVLSLTRKLHFQDKKFPLALAGGVLVHAPSFCEAIVKRLIEAGIEPQPITVVAEPVRGSVLIARSKLIASSQRTD